MKLDYPTKKHVFEQSLESSKRYLFDRTLTLFDYKNSMDIGTGTIFRIGQRVLIATAAHVIKGNPNGRIWPATEKVRRDTDGFPAYAKYAKHPRLDVGYLEVCREGVEAFFGDRIYCSIDDISIAGVGRRDKSVIVVGSPGQHTQSIRLGENRTSITSGVLFYWTVPPLVEKWPESPAEDPLNISEDFVVEYPSDEQMNSEGFPAINLPHPGGISGGGIWDQGFDSDEIWAPEKSRLVAIQSRWHPMKRYLRAVQVSHWLSLIYRDYPDLRDAIIETHGEGPWDVE